jgi:two-component system, cell cycle sensor histidine kinase and response regulator CckA
MKHARHELWSSAEVSRLVALLSSERDYLESILNVIPIPVAVLTDELAIEAGNDAFWEAAGMKRHSGLRRSIGEITGDPVSGTAIRAALDECRETVLLAQQTFQVRRLPESDEILLTGHTAGQQVQLLSRETQTQRYREIFRYSPDASFVLDAKGVVKELNKAASALAGEDCRGRAFAELVQPEQATGTAEALLAASGRPFEVKLAGRTLEITACPVPEAGATVATARDITDRIEVEQEARFGDRMTAVSRLAGGVSHELNNILTVITSYCHIALEQVGENGPGAEEIQAILKGAGDATQLGNQLVSLGRRHAFHDSLTDLNTVIAGLERTLKAICGDTARLHIEMESKLPPVYADPRQLDRALIALVLHARDASEPGGQINLRTGRAGSRDKRPPSLLPATEYVTLSIKDSRGWPPEAIGLQMLEPFAPYPGTKKSAGLDLAVAYSIIRQCRGEVVIQSGPAGATVTLYFPVRQVATADAAPAAPPKKEGTVLLVDDNAEIRSAIRHMLERQGFEVIESAGPEQALDLVEHGNAAIDVLLSDVNMPEMSGRELARRARNVRPGMKVLMMSGYADEEIDVGALEETVVFLQKPFPPERLIRTVRTLLQAGVS